MVVSVNHRLGLLGYNALPAIQTGTEEENSGNFGLLDLAAALDWARQQKRPVLRVGGRAISSGRDHLSEYLGP